VRETRGFLSDWRQGEGFEHFPSAGAGSSRGPSLFGKQLRGDNLSLVLQPLSLRLRSAASLADFSWAVSLAAYSSVKFCSSACCVASHSRF